MPGNNFIDYQIIHSLARSRIRFKVLKYLASIYPNPSYAQEMARSLGFEAAHVTGAIKGMGTKYCPHKALINLGLVEEVVNDVPKVKLYKATSKAVNLIRTYELHPIFNRLNVRLE